MTPSSTPSRTALLISYGLSTVVVLFLLADAGISLFAPHLLAEAQSQVGFSADLAPLIGCIVLLCALAFAIPRTSVVGAILITAFAGGAICAHVRVGELGSPPQIVAMSLAVLAWFSLWLRNADLRRAVGYEA